MNASIITEHYTLYTIVQKLGVSKFL